MPTVQTAGQNGNDNTMYEDDVLLQITPTIYKIKDSGWQDRLDARDGHLARIMQAYRDANVQAPEFVASRWEASTFPFRGCVYPTHRIREANPPRFMASFDEGRTVLQFRSREEMDMFATDQQRTPDARVPRMNTGSAFRAFNRRPYADCVYPEYVFSESTERFMTSHDGGLCVKYYDSLAEMHAADEALRGPQYTRIVYPKYDMCMCHKYCTSFDGGMTQREFKSLEEMHASAKLEINQTPPVS